MGESVKEKGAALAGRIMLGVLSSGSGDSTASSKDWAKMTPDQRRYLLEKAVGMHPEEGETK